MEATKYYMAPTVRNVFSRTFITLFPVHISLMFQLVNLFSVYRWNVCVCLC